VSVVVIGLEHNQAPLPLLEAAAVADADLHKLLSTLSHRRNLQETVVLSTCLRTEIYAVVDRFHDAVAEIYEVLSDHSGLSSDELMAHAVIRFDDDVTAHLFSVTAGLESAVTGETEVVGQVRRAFERAFYKCWPTQLEAESNELQFDVRGKNVLLVDDCIATGTSVRFVHSQLLAGGARTVTVGAICLSDDSPLRPGEPGFPAVYINRLSQFYPWSANHPDHEQYLRWLAAHDLKQWE